MASEGSVVIMAKTAARVSKRQAGKGNTENFWWDLALRLAFVALLLGAWQAAYYWLVVRNNDLSRGALFPSPLEVGAWIWHGFALDYFTGGYEPPPGMKMPHSFLTALGQVDYPKSILASLKRLLEGYAIATAIGFPLGLMVARWAIFDKTVGWLAGALQSLPSICWIPLAVLWFGRLDEAPILFVTIMGSLFATIVTVSDGLRAVPPLMSRAGRTLGATGPRLYFAVLLPAALPGIVSGLKVGWGYAWRSLMAAELIVTAGGLGFLLDRDRGNNDAAGVLATIIVIIALGLVVQEAFFTPVQRRLERLWGLTGSR